MKVQNPLNVFHVGCKERKERKLERKKEWTEGRRKKEPREKDDLQILQAICRLLFFHDILITQGLAEQVLCDKSHHLLSAFYLPSPELI